MSRTASASGAQVPAETVAAAIQRALQALHAEGGGSSQAVGRVLMLTEPPSADAGEITDKGYVNQGAVLKRRAGEVELLHAAQAGARRR